MKKNIMFFILVFSFCLSHTKNHIVDFLINNKKNPLFFLEVVLFAKATELGISLGNNFYTIQKMNLKRKKLAKLVNTTSERRRIIDQIINTKEDPDAQKTYEDFHAYIKTLLDQARHQSINQSLSMKKYKHYLYETDHVIAQAYNEVLRCFEKSNNAPSIEEYKECFNLWKKRNT